MKNVFLSLFVVCSLNAQGQPLPLSFSVLEESYSTLENDTIISEGDWDDGYWIVPIGFTFHYMDSMYQHVFFNGPFGGFGSELLLGEYVDNGVYDLLCPALIDVMESASDADISNMSYVTAGTSPNRIFKIQWGNCGVNGDANGTMRVNYQVWFYETTNSIDFRYGPSVDFDNGEVGFTVGLPAYLGNNWNSTETGNNCEGFWMMQNAVDNPDFNFAFATDDLFSDVHLDELPPLGTVYHFEGEVQSVSDFSQGELLIYPSVALDIVRVKSDLPMNSLSVFNQVGEVVLQKRPYSASFELEVASLAAGLYTVVAESNQAYFVSRFIKQ